jgi:hypothetical protein
MNPVTCGLLVTPFAVLRGKDGNIAMEMEHRRKPGRSHGAGIRNGDSGELKSVNEQ